MNKTDIVNVLKDKVASFSYVKTSGEVRQAKGTLHESFLPESTSVSTATENPDVVTYFDTEANGWRSFRTVNFNGFA